MLPNLGKAITSGAVAGVAASFLLLSPAPEAPPHVASASAPAREASATSSSIPGAFRGALQPPAESSLATRLRGLASTGKAEDAQTAWQILMQCHIARRALQEADLTKFSERDQISEALSKHLPEHASRACQDLSGLDLALRLPLLELAAAEGLPEAAVHLINEGPFGDPTALEHRPNDPAVVAWRTRMIDLLLLAASNGDVAALSSLANQYATGGGIIGKQDPALALSYEVARNIVREETTGIKPMGAQRMLGALASKISPDARAQALERGVAMANAALAGKK